MKTDSFEDLLADLNGLKRSMRKEESGDSRAQIREAHLKNLLKNKIPDSYIKLKVRKFRELYNIPDEAHLRNEDEDALQQVMRSNTKKDKQLLTLFSKEEPAMRNELKELTEKREQWKTERKPLIEKQIKEKEEELKKETEKIEMAVLSDIDKWIEIHPNDKGSMSYPL